MTAGISQPTSSRRDAGLRRLRVANRVLAVAAIVLTLALAELAAHGFHGHARKLVVRSTPLRLTQSTAPARHHRSETPDGASRVRHRRAVGKLRPPAQPPRSATPAALPPAPPAAPAPAQPAAAPSPSTTVSGGS